MSEAPPPAVEKYLAFLKGAGDRPLHIWGAGNQGRGLCRALERLGTRVEGFLDSSPLVASAGALGYRVRTPQQFFSEYGEGPRPFIIIASFFFEKDIAEECIRAGYQPDEDFISYTSIKPHDYAVDISGVCNLRCISCPRAKRDRRRPPEGFMKLDTFIKVLDKIVSEDPLAGSVQLYQWGEPLLNPQVAQIIEYANSLEVLCAVSSNLNSERNLKEAVAAKPGWFRVSVSGWGKNYERTHTGGSWEAFYRNFELLKEYRLAYSPGMKTEVYYHVYKHNRGEDEERIRDLCGEAGFEFHPVYAYLICLDDVLEHLEGGALPEEARQAAEMLALPLEEGMERARCERTEECLALRCIHVNWNLEVSNCMMFYYPEDNRAADNFLETPLSAIVKERRSSALCRRCRSQALHRYCSVYSKADAHLSVAK